MKFWVITRKDLKLLLRDRRTLTVLVVLPLIFITIIGMTTGQLLGWQQSNQILQIVYVDTAEYEEFDDLPATQMLRDPKRQKNLAVKIINGIQNMSGMEAVSAPSREAAQELLDRDKGDGILIIGPRFAELVSVLEVRDLSPSSSKMGDGLASFDMEFVSDNPDLSQHTVIEQLLLGTVQKTLIDYLFCSHRGKDLLQNREIQRECSSLKAEADKPVLAFDPPQDEEVKPDDTVYRELIPNFTVMFVFFLVNIMARSFIHERDLGTLRRLQIAPITPVSVLAGKTIPFLIVSLIQAVLLFVCGKLVYQMSWGANPWMLLPVIVCTSLAATALGLLVATLVRNDAQVSAYANAVVIIMAGISGCFMPRDWLPDVMKEISLFTPHAWALIAYYQLLNVPKPDLTVVYESCAMLFGFAVLYFTLGCVRFGKMV
jgi:ABC-2 type transport system permease protein